MKMKIKVIKICGMQWNNAEMKFMVLIACIKKKNDLKSVMEVFNLKRVN